MTAAATSTYDISRLSDLCRTLAAVLFGDGATPGQLQGVLRVQAGLCAYQISQDKRLGSTTLPEGQKKVERDMRNVFFPLRPGRARQGDQYQGSATTFASEEKGGNDPSFIWLFAYGGNYGGAGNEPSFLVGAEAKDILGDTGDMKKAFYAEANRTRGVVWKDLGERIISTPGLRPKFKRFNKSQHAIKLNRVVVTPAAYAKFKAKVMSTLGQLRASFASAAKMCKLDRQDPAWVSAQIENVRANGKAIFDGSRMNHPTEPSITFGSSAKGVISNPIITDAIHSAVGYRTKVLTANILKILKGAAYDFSTGATYFPKEKADE